MLKAFDKARSWVTRAWARGCAWAHKLASQIRPPVSLATGSLLVLLTLLLPIGYDACGPPRLGYQLVRGKGEWPTFLGIFASTAGRDFYLVVLLLAAFTLLLVLVSGLHSGVVRNKSLAARLALLAATVSLLLVCDVTLLLAVASGDQFGTAAVVPLLASCLAPDCSGPTKASQPGSALWPVLSLCCLSSMLWAFWTVSGATGCS